MNVRRNSRIVLAAVLVAAACFSTPASARHGNHVVRDVLLAPLLLPPAILAATLSEPVVYEYDRPAPPPRYYGHGRYDRRPPPPPPRRGGYYRDDGPRGGYYRHDGPRHHHYR